MNAIVKISGKQYSVEKDTKLYVDKLQEKEGAKVKFDDVLMVDNGKDTKIGNPLVVGASVEAKIVKHFKDKKIIVFKKKRRKGYKVKNGHRQQMTEIIIEKVNEKSASKAKVATKYKEEKPNTISLKRHFAFVPKIKNNDFYKVTFREVFLFYKQII